MVGLYLHNKIFQMDAKILAYGKLGMSSEAAASSTIVIPTIVYNLDSSLSNQSLLLPSLCPSDPDDL